MKTPLLLILLPTLLLARPPRSLLPVAVDSEVQLKQLQEVMNDTSSFPADRISPGGNFRVHYHTDGQHSATSTFVDSVCLVAEQVLLVESGTMGYLEAPRWADGMYHIYLQNLSSMFGYTQPTEAVNYSDPGGPQYSRLILDNDYPEELFEMPPQESLRITLAHEYFHAIQLGLFDCTGQRWFMELTATWMEDQVYGQIDDWFRYLPAYLNSLDQSMRLSNGQREYGMALWAHYLTQRFGTILLLDAWYQGAATRGDLMTICQELAPEDSWELFTQFQLWNMLTAERAQPTLGYLEAQLFPAAPVLFLSGTGLYETEELALSALAVDRPVYAELTVSVGSTWLMDRRNGSHQSLCCGQSVTTGLDEEKVLLHAVAAGGANSMALTLEPLQALQDGQISLFNIYPNPAVENAQLNLYALEPLQSELHLYDLLGRRLLTLPVSGAGEFSMTLPLSEYPAGVYVLELDGNHRRVLRLY